VVLYIKLTYKNIKMSETKEVIKEGEKPIVEPKVAAKKPTTKAKKVSKPKIEKPKGISEKEEFVFAKEIGYRALKKSKFEEATVEHFKGKKVGFEYINNTQVYVIVDGVKTKEYYVVN